MVIPQFMAGANLHHDAKKMNAASGKSMDQKLMEKIRAELRRCCETARDEDGFNSGSVNQHSNNQHGDLHFE